MYQNVQVINYPVYPLCHGKKDSIKLHTYIQPEHKNKNTELIEFISSSTLKMEFNYIHLCRPSGINY